MKIEEKMVINSLFDVADFDLASGVIHLAASGESPFLRQAYASLYSLFN